MTSSIATKSKTRTAPEPEPTGPAEPSLDEQVARRMLDWHGDSVIDVYLDRVRRAEAGWLADHDDPYRGYQRMNGWCASRRLWARDRHATEAHAGLLRAVATGSDVVPVDEAEIDAAVAKDLVGLYCRNCRGAFGRLVAAARRKMDAAASERDEIGARLTSGSFFDPRSTTAWCDLRSLLEREQELTLTVGRMGSLLDDLGPALAGHVVPVFDSAPADRVVLGMCLASLPGAPAPLDSDPELVRLTSDLVAASRRCDAVSAAGSAPEKAALTDLERELSEPIALAIRERRALIESERSRAATAALESVRASVEAARSGDVAAIEVLIDAARAHASDFPESLASRLHAASVAGFVEDAAGWAGLLESA